MKIKSMKSALLGGLLLCAAGIMTVQANTIVTFSVDMATNFANGTFNPPLPDGTGTNFVSVRGNFQTNAWSLPGLILVRQGSSTVYTNTYNVPDTSIPNGHCISYRFNLNGVDPAGNESTASWDNRAVTLPSTSGASLVLPTPYFGDVGPGQIINVTFQVDMSEQIVLNRFTNNVSQLDVRGSFNGWANTGLYFTRNPSILVTNYNPAFPPGGIVTSNVYTLTVPITTGAEVPGVPATNAFMEWKAVITASGNWENPSPVDFNDANNRFWCNNTNQVLPIVSFSDLPYAPLAQARLNVDMTAVALFDPNYVYPSVTVWGTFNNWANGVNLTNNPAAANTNIFSTVITVVQGAENTYQFRYTNSFNLANNIDSGWVYDYVNDLPPTRRTLTVPPPLTFTNVPVVFFNDLSTNDYLTTDTVVTFSVNMTNAVGSEGHVWDPNSDTLYINGDFDGSGWYDWNPIALSGRVCNNTPPVQVYYFQYTFPQGHQRRLQYQYSTSYSVINTTTGDETLSGLNHDRYIRGTSGSYTLPLDTFGSMTSEIKFGNLAIGLPSGGSFPVTWLGYPGVYLQNRTNLLNGTWLTNTATGGQNSTNWPNSSSSSQFFRLIQP